MCNRQRQWERRLREEKLGPVEPGERYYDAAGQRRRVASIDYQMSRLNDPDAYQGQALFEGSDIQEKLAKLEAAVPEEIRRIAERDHRQRTRAEKRQLQAWVETAGWQLLVQLGLRRG